MQNLVNHLFARAKIVRGWCEGLAVDAGKDPATLQGYCCIAAYELFCQLRSDASLQSEVVLFAKSEFHAYVLVRGLVVDITATQFINADPIEGVWIADLSDEPDAGVWLASETASTPDEVLGLTCWGAWPRNELPLPLQTS
jgi:hypothetical protein